ncbi:MAG: ABC transporter substrate-binding protein [Pseudobdellovibrio sp.]
MIRALIASFILILMASAFAKEVELTPIHIAYSQTVVNAQIGLILEKTDILKKNGFNAVVKGLPSGKELKTAMVAGESDVILCSESVYVVLRSSGFKAQAISTFGSAGRLALVVKKDGKISKLDDLKGKKIGALFGTTVHQRALEWKNKIDTNGIELISLGSAAALSAALEAGSVDAVMMWDPFLEQSLRNNKVTVLGTSDFDLINVMSDSFAEKNPKVTERINRVFTEAFGYLISHRKEVNEWYGEIAKISPDTLDAASKINKNYSAKMTPDAKDFVITKAFIENLKSVAQFLFKEKVIPVVPTLD